MIFNTFIISIFISTLFALTILTTNISVFNKNQKLCIQTVLKIQTNHRITLKKLFKLNTKAFLLRRELSLAKKSLKIAFDPSSKSAALAWLTKIKAQQLVLHKMQKTLIISADIFTQKYKTQFYLTKKIFLKARNLRESLSSTPKNSLSPSYSLRVNFEKTKKISSTIKFNLIHPFKKNKTKATYKCQSTIKKKLNQLGEVTLIADKRSLKRLVF